MGFNRIVTILEWEREKYTKRGYFNILCLFMLLIYFYCIPRSILFISTLFPYSSQSMFYTLGTYIVHLAGYLLSNLVFFLMYYSNNPWIESFKINSEPWPWQKNKAEFHETLKKVFKQALLNQLVATPLALLITGFDSNYIISTELPPITEIITQVMVFILCEDFFFYFSHRMLHLP